MTAAAVGGHSRSSWRGIVGLSGPILISQLAGIGAHVADTLIAGRHATGDLAAGGGRRRTVHIGDDGAHRRALCSGAHHRPPCRRPAHRRHRAGPSSRPSGWHFSCRCPVCSAAGHARFAAGTGATRPGGRQKTLALTRWRWPSHCRAPCCSAARSGADSTASDVRARSWRSCWPVWRCTSRSPGRSPRRLRPPDGCARLRTVDAAGETGWHWAASPSGLRDRPHCGHWGFLKLQRPRARAQREMLRSGRPDGRVRTSSKSPASRWSHCSWRGSAPMQWPVIARSRI